MFKTGQSSASGNGGLDSDEEQGISEDKLAEFKKGISEYLLTHFYVKKRKEADKEKKKMSSEL